MKNKFQFVFKWSLITSAGWVVAQILGVTVTQIFYPHIEIRVINTSPLYWLVFGIVFGLSQWFVLRKEAHSSRLWINATVIGFYIGALILKILISANIIPSDFGAHVLASFVLGFAQYVLFLRQRFEQAGWWILATTLSWVFAQILIGFHILWVQLFGILLFTIITGFVMAGFIQRPIQSTA
jgi:hypothetical protein